MDTLEILIQARDEVARMNIDEWTFENYEDTACLMDIILDITRAQSYGYGATMRAIMSLIDWDHVWQDTPPHPTMLDFDDRHTESEVIAAFDAAIKSKQEKKNE